MPSGCKPLKHSSSFLWWLPASSSLSPWWREVQDAGSGSSPPNKLDLAQDLEVEVVLPLVFCYCGDGGREGVRSCFDFLSWCCQTLDPSFQRWWCPPLIWRKASALEADDGDPDLRRRWFRRSYGACHGRSVFIDNPTYLLAERRPFSFLLAKMPDGRQCCSKMESVVFYYRGLAGPSGLSPVPAMIGSVDEQLDPIAFAVSLQGLFRKIQGIACNFQFLWGLLCKMYCPPL